MDKKTEITEIEVKVIHTTTEQGDGHSDRKTLISLPLWVTTLLNVIKKKFRS